MGLLQNARVSLSLLLRALLLRVLFLIRARLVFVKQGGWGNRDERARHMPQLCAPARALLMALLRDFACIWGWRVTMVGVAMVLPW